MYWKPSITRIICHWAFFCNIFCCPLGNFVFKKFWTVFKLMVKLSPHHKFVKTVEKNSRHRTFRSNRNIIHIRLIRRLCTAGKNTWRNAVKTGTQFVKGVTNKFPKKFFQTLPEYINCVGGISGKFIKSNHANCRYWKNIINSPFSLYCKNIAKLAFFEIGGCD